MTGQKYEQKVWHDGTTWRWKVRTIEAGSSFASGTADSRKEAKLKIQTGIMRYESERSARWRTVPA